MLKPHSRAIAAEHDEDEQQAGHVDARHQLAELDQRAEAVACRW